MMVEDTIWAVAIQSSMINKTLSDLQLYKCN